MTPLLPPPDTILDENGDARFGKYSGPLGLVDVRAREKHAGLLSRVLRRKKWFYVAVSTDELYLGCAIVNAGYAANAFAFAASPKTGMLARSSHLGLPGLSCQVSDRAEAGARAFFRAPKVSFEISRGSGTTYEVRIDTKELQVDARLSIDGAPPPITAICAPPGGDVNVTSKRALLTTSGTVTCAGRTFALKDGLGGFDYTHGFLPRETKWRWAYLLGRTTSGEPVGMNLVEGFNGEPECAVWVGRELFSVGEGRFDFDRDAPLSPWRITTTCGQVDVRFSPVGVHSEKRNLLLVRSEFIQPVGTYSGTLALKGRGPLTLEGVPGVAEDQSVLW